MDTSKKVSVVMAVYNRAATLDEAIDSIFAQSYPNWELILCDDGSTDSSYTTAKVWADRDPSRVKLLRSPNNEGAAAARNHCLDAATGDYIAIMDSDDISLPERLAVEVDFLNTHPEYAVVGSAIIPFDEMGDHGVRRIGNEDSLTRLRSCMHATLMARRQVFQRLGGYTVSPRLRRGEDLEFWFRLSAETEFLTYNLPTPLYKIREDRAAYRRRTVRDGWNATRIYLSGFRRLGYSPRERLAAFKPLISALAPKPLLRRYHLFLDRKQAQS